MLEAGFDYKVTVIIPVYNVEKYLRDTLDSLLAQTISQEEMEVLMINDGSPDGSLAVCEEYAEKYPNFKVISQENQGVSATRNNGIRNAEGKYLLYLDGDDTLSPATVKNVTDFFDEHYDEVDVVTYPLVYRRETGESRHWRYDKYLKKTGVYDLEEFPYICQTTMNICVKNDSKKHLFDQTLTMAEDQTYISECLLKRGKIGFINGGTYFYLQHGNNNSKLHNHPYYAAEDIIYFFECLAQKMQDFPEIKNYLGSMIMYNLSWRISDDCLYPYHYSQEMLSLYKMRLSVVIDKIDAELILNYPKMNDAHKYFLLSLKTDSRPFFQIQRNHKTRQNEILLLDESGKLSQDANILLVLEQCKIEDDSLYILAYLKEWAFEYVEKPQLFAVIDNETYVEIPLFLSQQSCFWSRVRTNTFWGFSFEKDLCDFSTIKFVVKIEGKEFTTKFWFGDRQGIQPERKRSYIEGRNYAILAKGNQLFSFPREASEIYRAKKGYEKFLFRDKRKQWLVRWYAHKRQGRIIWLYEDTYNAEDNAYYQFQHDFGKNDGIERYYICDKQSIDWKSKFSPRQQKYLVQRQGKKHKKLFIQADKILTSFIGRGDFVPFDKDTILYYWDLFHFEVIYLQHGVMHAELPNMYSKEKIYMVDKVVASTHFEKENLVNKLAFREKDVICSGMPRLDHLTVQEKQKKILFAPSWRSYLVSTDSNGKRLAQSNFENSDYFQEIKAFLVDERLKKLLAKNKYRLEIKLHPNFEVYAEAFGELCDENMAVVERAELGEYVAFFTDFTSFMYDCFYLSVPVITHIFDYGRFKAGLHTYRDLCWPMEKEYPFYCKDIDAVIQMLDRVVAEDAGLERKMKEYVEGIFFNRDQKHCDRLYDYLMGKVNA